MARLKLPDSKGIRRPAAALLLVVLTIGLTALLLDWRYPLRLPQSEQLFARVVTDRQGEPLRAFADARGVWRYPVSADQVSPLYLQALLGYEDRWFYRHPGINPLALVRAAWQNLRAGRIISGGSTLSMQVARLLHPHRRSLGGKLQQMLRTLQLEWHLSKQQILELYLNLAPFGGTLEGVQAASYSYLGKSAAELSHAEAALLAVLPQAPTRLRPDRAPARAQQARDKVLQRLATLEIWPPTVSRRAMQEPVAAFRPEQPNLAPLLARRLIRQYPHQRLIRSSIDRQLQQALQDYLAYYIRRLPPHSSAAALLVDNQDHSVLAYAGSAVFGDAARSGHVDMVQAIRSPGSTLKPFLYGMAIEEGLVHSESLLSDLPLVSGSYRPDNFSSGFSGPVSASEALQRSLNIPAVSLLQRFGSARFAARLANAGAPLSIPGDRAGLAVILGGAGTTLEQLVSLYSSLSTEGLVYPLQLTPPVMGVKPAIPRYLMAPGAAWISRQILSRIRRPGAPLRHSSLQARPGLAWKTGTSYGFRDAWAIGVSQRYSIGVWVGRPDGSPLPGHYGRITAGPLLFTLYDRLQDESVLSAAPDTVSRAAICWPEGLSVAETPAAQCHRRRQAWLLHQQIPPSWQPHGQNPGQGSRVRFWQDSKTGERLLPGCITDTKVQRDVALWPQALEPWLPPRWHRAQQIPPLSARCSHRAPDTAPLRISELQAGSHYRLSDRPQLTLTASGGSGQRFWYINGRYRYQGPPDQVLLHPLSQRGPLQLLVTDESGNIDRIAIEVH
ncbi:penicillin-binding protein 1C [Marinobacterium jannaschii]|uniref:penicillin-binding protein 1C n=1 Tax=Marinobacterium jannaschii TaxID=64970 RepID=UPI000A48205A|nr:penicillin-binding protein 1C [Marinobacterium jannaschii]